MDIEKEVLEWHKETFPNATTAAVMRKCIEESHEKVEAMLLDEPVKNIAMEIADETITNIVWLNRHGFSLEGVVRDKLAILYSREWGEELEDGNRLKL